MFSVGLMTSRTDPTTLLCGGAYIFLAFFAVGLWVFALLRTRMVFCYSYIMAAVVAAFISVITVGMYLDPYIWVRLLVKPAGEYRITSSLSCSQSHMRSASSAR